jgi:hypothetical protein
VVWIFRVGDHTGGILWTHEMLHPLFLFVLTLGVDLGQYIYQSIQWGCMNTHYWRKYGKDDADVLISGKWNWPAIGAFWVKIGLCVDAYLRLLYLLNVQLAKAA